jgi:hypothetical protein
MDSVTAIASRKYWKKKRDLLRDLLFSINDAIIFITIATEDSEEQQEMLDYLSKYREIYKPHWDHAVKMVDTTTMYLFTVFGEQ